MSKTVKNSPALGLDIGTSRIVAACQTAEGFRFQSQLNAFVAVPASKMTQTALEREKIPYLVEGGEIWIHGTDSQRFADLLNSEVRRPMMGGFLNPNEPENVRVIAEIVKLLTGSGGGNGIHLCFSVPSAPAGAEPCFTWHEATLKQALGELGFEVKCINEGLAVVYSELEESNYTGIGISCGGGLCNVCFSYLSVPILSFSIPKAGDFIDTNAAAVSGERANRVRILKEQEFQLNGHYPSKVHQVLGIYYDDMIRTLIKALVDGFRSANNLPKLSRPVPLVLSGGSAQPNGFLQRFGKILSETPFPIEISEVRMASDPLTATAKGALLATLAEL